MGSQRCVVTERAKMAGAQRRVVPLLLLAAAISSTVFVGHFQAPGRSCNTAMEAEKAKKKKQKMSLAEALDRQKKEAEMDKSKKEEAKLEAEEVFWEGPPSSTEMFAPFFSCFVVIGIIPFIAAVNRQFRVKYKITNKRVSVTGGFDGKDITEFSYQEIYEMKYGQRWFGYCADMRINLRDGAKVELFGLLNFEENYNFMLSKCDKDARKRSDPPPPVSN
ncbi:bPH_2 domain-containing protein [Durusdinium trenchii]|uniref:BPH_2 domain-containing protein n=2 Tax=Durusdinium trenchii TaxID=1381693 RepID=A0ABP0RAK2_9DINO